MIYKYALDRIPKSQAQELFKNYTMFEKKFGDRRGIEDVIVSKRRFQYEEEVKVYITNQPSVALKNQAWLCVENYYRQYKRNFKVCASKFYSDENLWLKRMINSSFVLFVCRQTHTTTTHGLIIFVWWRVTQTLTL